MSRLSKEIFRNTSLSSVILPYYSNPLSARKMMLKLCKGSRSIWTENDSQWSHLLTNLRTSVNILSCRTAINHVNYLAKISPFVELGFSINFGTPEDIKFVEELSSLIEDKSLSKFKVNMILPLNKNSGWESEATVNLILSIVNLISETNKQFEVNIGGRNIKITELPDWIKLIRENIFGESQWIVNQSQSRFFRLLGEYTQVWEEIGVGELDSEIINKIKSPDEINHFIYSITPKGSERGTILNLHADFLNQRHKND